MAPIVLEDLNVFTFPHSRMRKLMNCCTSKVGHTDFTSLNAFEGLLIRLERTFIEFQAHEEIENQYVMRKLKHKIREDASMTNTELICNCHKIDRFTPLISFFRDGYAFIRRGNADRLSYGIKLHKAMSHFHQDFLPHMIEEENDIQPLLSKYFNENELKIMRIDVIKMTLQKRKNPETNFVYPLERPLQIYILSSENSISINHFSNQILENIFKYLSNEQLKESCLTINQQWHQCTLRALEKRSPISQIPNEILLKLFASYLNPYDLLSSCIRVNQQWRNVIAEKSIWRVLNPVNWAKKQWNCNLPLEFHSGEPEENGTDEANELRIFNGLTTHFLPNYGSAIENLILSGSVTINDNTARKMLNLCPNLKHLNLSMTKLTAKTFLQYRWLSNLHSLNVEGCELMDDCLFVNLVKSNKQSSENALEHLCCQTEHFDSLSPVCQKCSLLSAKRLPDFQLNILNLSGCYRLTDQSLRLLMSNGFTSTLTYLDLSGCSALTIDGISALLSSAKSLSMENVYLCDNIPLSSSLATVNCCRNLEDPSGRFCCRASH